MNPISPNWSPLDHTLRRAFQGIASRSSACMVPATFRLKPSRPRTQPAPAMRFLPPPSVSMAEGLSLWEAARRASIVAALTVTRIGTQAAFPTRASVDQWQSSKGTEPIHRRTELRTLSFLRARSFGVSAEAQRLVDYLAELVRPTAGGKPGKPQSIVSGSALPH